MNSKNDKPIPSGIAGIVGPSLLGVLSACFAFLFYGGWGYWVNLGYGHEMALKVFMAQGSYSFILTLIMTMLIEGLYRLFTCRGSRDQWSRSRVDWSTILSSCFVVFSGSWLVNVFAGTPEIFKTVLLGYMFGGLYTYVYVLGLSRRKP